MREEYHVYKPCDKCGKGYHYEQPFAAVFFFKHWTYKEYDRKISHKMAHICVTQNVGEKAYVEKRVGKGASVDREKQRC